MTQKELEIKINTKVEAGNSAETFRELKREIRELNETALLFGDKFPEAARKAQQEAAKLADRLDDTRENLADLKGEPLEQIRASVGRLQEGFMNLDLGKITQSFKNLGTAVSSAGGIFALLIGAVVLIIENFDTLKNSGGVVGAVFTAIGDTVEFFKDLLLDLADALGIVDRAMVEQMDKEKKAKESKEQLTQATKLYNDEQDRELQLLRAKGASEEDILRKQKSIIEARLKQDDELRKSAKKTTDQEIEAGAVRKALGLDKMNDESFFKQPVNPLFKDTLGDSGRRLKNIQDSGEAEKEVTDEKAKQLLLTDKQRSDLDFELKLIEAKLSNTKKITTELTKQSSVGSRPKLTDGSEFGQVDETLPASQVKPPEDIVPNYFMSPEYIQYKSEYEERLQQIERENQAYKQLGSTFEDMAAKFNSGGNSIAASIAQSFGGVKKSIGEAITSFKQGFEEGVTGFVDKALGAASSLVSAFSNIMNASTSQQIERSKRETDARINDLSTQLDAGIINQEVFNQRKYELELDQYNKETELKKQAFEQNKAIQIVQAIILSTQAALAAFTQGNIVGGPVVGGIFAGIAAAFGAVQVALIASQEFPGNGKAPSRPSAGGTPPSPGSLPNPLAIGDIGGRLTTTNQQEEMRVYVLEKDITSAQGRTAQIKNRSRR
jgi:hypothetical protein